MLISRGTAPEQPAKYRPIDPKWPDEF